MLASLNRFAATSRRVAIMLVMAMALSLSNSVAPANAEECFNSDHKGTDEGFYFQIWKDNPGTVNFCPLDGGRYTAQWSGVNNWLGGKGWRIGSRRTVSYSGTFDSPRAWLALYGWTTDPLVEYYIVDNWGGNDRPPPEGQNVGTVFSDGDTYDVYRAHKTKNPSILKRVDAFDQYWSVRRHRRSSGTITAGNHFDAWAALGMNLGTFNYQIIAIESYLSGSADVTVSTGDSSTLSP